MLGAVERGVMRGQSAATAELAQTWGEAVETRAPSRVEAEEVAIIQGIRIDLIPDTLAMGGTLDWQKAGAVGDDRAPFRGDMGAMLPQLHW